nr:class B sortase [uncultured Acetatifactor sp.]
MKNLTDLWKFIELHGKWRSRLAVIFCILAVICFGVVFFVIYDMRRSYAISEGKVDELRRLSELAEPVGEGADQTLPQTVVSHEEKTEVKTENPYAEVFSMNDDMVAWLLIEGTKIDYPVMQTPEDENYYLHRDFYGNEDQAGCLILDTDSSLQGEITTNQIIHGHNMRAGTMFGDLDLYQDEEYCKNHSRIRLFTRETERNYEVISVFYSQVYLTTDLVFKYYNFFQADTEEEFQYFYDNIKALSLFDTGVEAEFGDRFLTLSTCSYQVEEGRFVVVAKEVEPGA